MLVLLVLFVVVARVHHCLWCVRTLVMRWRSCSCRVAYVVVPNFEYCVSVARVLRVLVY